MERFTVSRDSPRADRGTGPGRTTALSRVPVDGFGRAVFLCLLAALLFASAGCARRVPLNDLEGGDAEVHVRLVTDDGESYQGRLIALDAARTVIVLTYEIREDVRLRGYGDDAELLIGGERVSGDLVEVGRNDSGQYALVSRSFPTKEIASAAFYPREGERSLASILSMLVGPLIGLLAGFVI